MDKKGLAILIGQLKPKGSDEPDGDEGGDSREAGLAATGDEVLSAIEAGDRSAFVDALRAFVLQCQEGDE